MEVPEIDHSHARVDEILKKTQHISTEDDETDDADDAEDYKELGSVKNHGDNNIEHGKAHGSRSPMVINIILGLCCGILVIMLVVVIVMVVQRRRVARPRVVIAENNDDREHLVQMQKSGFENPTYKFFYY